MVFILKIVYPSRNINLLFCLYRLRHLECRIAYEIGEKMKHKTKHLHSSEHKPYDVKDIRHHIIAAVKEILLFAPSVLKFCRNYIKTTMFEYSRPRPLKFVQNVISAISLTGQAVVRTPRRAAPTLVKALKNKNPYVTRTAALALRKLGPAAIPALTLAAKDRNEHVRRKAILLLRQIGKDTKQS